MRPDVVVVNPRKRPSSTTMRTTAKTTPVTVTSRRTLSWTRLRQASSEGRSRIVFTPCYDVTVLSMFQKNLPSLQSVDERVDHRLDDLLAISPWESIVDDEERGDAVQRRPGGARGDVGVDLPELLRLHAVGNRVAQRRERPHAVRPGRQHFLLPLDVEVSGRRQHERGNVVVGIFQAER